MSRAISVFVSLGLTACHVCGTYSYRGFEVEEHCGAVYGTQGLLWEGNGVVELSFESSTPLDRPSLEWGLAGEPFLTARFWGNDLERGTVLGPDDAIAWCTWFEAADAWGDTTIPHDGPATAFELEVLGRPLDTDYGSEGPLRRFSWFIECDDGEVWSEGTDAVRLRASSGHAHPEPP